MTADESKMKPAAGEPSGENLLREKEALSQQVKRLIKAEGTLYEYQQVLDAQLREYKSLYELNKRLSRTFDVSKILNETVDYIVQNLEYEKAVVLGKSDGQGYDVCALNGYYSDEDVERVKAVTISEAASYLISIISGKDCVICKEDCKDQELIDLRDRLLMNEYILFPLRSHPLPDAILAVGNSRENALFYREISDCPDKLLGLGNLVGLISSQIENRIFLQQMETAREQERLAEARYRSIFENAVEGIFQRTPEGRYIDANRSLAHTLGYSSPAELISSVQSIRDQLYVEPQYHEELIRLLGEKGSVEGYEVRMYRKDRKVIWVSISMRVVRDGSGKVLYYEGTTEEITERKRAEEALRESEQKYRQLSEALEERVEEAVNELRQKDKILILQGRQAVMGEMISNIAHQWRQPLNMLALLVQDLQMTHRREGLSDDFVNQNVSRSLEIIRQMSKTIDYFRYFFRPDKEKVEFRVLETIERSVTILDGSLKIHGIETEIVHTGDPVVMGYQTEFVQVLLNILINARDALVKARPPRPLIRVRLFTEDGRTVVVISDNAGGVPEEIMDRIFNPYFTTKGPEQGTGIGLFMCKTIIEKNMGGSLTVRNTDEGAEFRIEV